MNAVAPIRVTDIGEYIRHRCCERRFKLGYDNRSLGRRLPFAERLFNPLDPVLQAAGRVREDEWERSLRDGAGYQDLSSEPNPELEVTPTLWEDFERSLQALQVGQCAYAREVQVNGHIGAFELQGRIDFIVVMWEGEEPRLRLVECKSSRKDRTYHRVQVALYKLLVASYFDANGLQIAGIDTDDEQLECVVARIDETTNEGQAILEMGPLNLDVVLADIERLLQNDGPLNEIVRTDLDDLQYQLDSKCDGCVFNVDCFPESARLRRLQLIGFDPSDIRILDLAGLQSIDQLANLDLDSAEAAQIRSEPGFSGNLEVMCARAQARRSTLPQGEHDPDDYEVVPLPGRWDSQLPNHEIDSTRLVRIYLEVDYDYTENRIGALAAHITSSAGVLKTDLAEVNGRWAPSAEISEELEDGARRPISGLDVIRFKTSIWTGRQEEDNGSERELIQGFLHELIDAIAEVAEAPEVPLHFYIWSRSEMRQLVEGCTRCGSDLLSHLKELLGCRESLEQLIFSCLGEEVHNRYGIGWTSRGLVAATSVRWFGDIFHWKRNVGGHEVDLDKVFTQDLFDFKTDLYLDGDNNWADRQDEDHARHKFEVRSRFHDSLPAPYWHAVWRTLPDPDRDELPANLRNAIRRYNRAAEPLRLREYLRTRSHALRWVEEHIRYKNDEISKPFLNIADLVQFDLRINTIAESALDFLRLEQHIRVAQWLSTHIVAPASRVSQGQTLPLTEVRATNQNEIVAQISADGYDIEQQDLEGRSTFGAGSFVRVSPYSGDPSRPQTIGQFFRGGSTCVVDEIDWETGRISLSVIPNFRADRYRLLSVSRNVEDEGFEYATLDESPSDYVAARVDGQLSRVQIASSYRWFDPVTPRLPEQATQTEEDQQRIYAMLEAIQFDGDNRLTPDQSCAISEGLDTTVQLLQGPPGTGKTLSTAVAILTRIICELDVGGIVIVAGTTHTAVDNLLNQTTRLIDSVSNAAEGCGLTLPPVVVGKVHSSDSEEQLAAPIENIRAQRCAAAMRTIRQRGVAVVGGTTNALLKMAGTLSGTAQYRNGFAADMLIVDEASMMVFPQFLALSTLVNDNGRLMLSGDHRQLAPILAHDWEREDRPPVVLYQPFVSAYDAVLRLAEPGVVSQRSVRRSALEYTFRLPPVVRSLISQLYRLDEIELRGPHRDVHEHQPNDDGEQWATAWGGPGLFLVVHNERQSRKRNPLEAEIIRRIMDSSVNEPPNSVAVITPHRAQRTLLQNVLENFQLEAPTIDTVERLQGGQRPTIIISATASDPSAIAASVEFILDLNRSNVAFSRVQQRLIVVCAESLLNHIAPALEHYDSAMLWKSLRSICTDTVLEVEVDGHCVSVRTPGAKVLEEIA